MDGSKATSQIGDNSFKSMKKKKQAQRRSVENKPSQKENISLLLPKLIIKNYEIHTLVPRSLFRLPLIAKRCAGDEVAKYNEQNQLSFGGFYWMKI